MLVSVLASLLAGASTAGAALPAAHSIVGSSTALTAPGGPLRASGPTPPATASPSVTPTPLRFHSVSAAPTPLVDRSQPRGATSGAVAKGASSGTGVVFPVLAPAAARSGLDIPLALGSGWDAINYTNSSCACTPPDVQVAAGPADIVEMTNLEEAVYSKTGTLLSSTPLASFFGVGSSSISDPRVLYDNLTGRWFASILNITGNRMSFGVSLTPDPMGSWYIYPGIAGNGTNELPDQPYLGVSNGMLLLSANDFNMTSGFEDGSQYTVINKSEVMAGAGAFYHTWGPVAYYPNARAVQALTSTAADVGYFQLVNPSNYFVEILITGVPSATLTQPSFTTQSALLATVVGAPPPAAQPSTAYTLDTSDGRILSAVWRNGVVTTALADGCGATSCARFTQAYTSNGTVIQDVNWQASYEILYPAATVTSAGDVLATIGLSGSTLYPSLAGVAMLANEPGYINGWYVKYGTSSWTSAWGCNATLSCRYGDYFGAALDPTSNVVWTAGEYINTTSLWSTHIESEVAAPLAVQASASPTVIDAGLSMNFTALASGGSGPVYTYAWTNLPAGCIGTTTATVPCAILVAGTYTAFVNVTDPQGRTVMAQAVVTVHAAPSLAAPTASVPGADAGQSATFTSAVPANGTGPFTFRWSGLPAGCGSANASSVTCTFAAAASLSLSVVATDSFGKNATSPSLAFNVSPALVVRAPTASPNSTYSGSSVTLTANVSGGSGGFHYAWLGLPSGCASSNAATITCTPNATGVFNVSVTVIDSNGAHVTSPTAKLSVTARPPPSNSSSGLFGLSGVTGWILIGAVAAIVVVLLAVLLARRRRRPPAVAPPPSASGAPPPGTSGGTPPPSS